MVYILIAAAVFLTDLCVKRYVDANWKPGEETPVLNGKVRIRKYYNEGAALNLLAKRPDVMKKLHAALMAAAGGAFLCLLPQKGKKGEKTALAMILGGGASNLYDRYRKGHVVDYLSFRSRFQRLSGIIFNLSDFFVFIGSALLFLFGRKERRTFL